MPGSGDLPGGLTWGHRTYGEAMPVFQTVVVGADASPTAEEAFLYALDLVKNSGGTLHVVSAYKRSAISTEGVPDEFTDGVDSPSVASAVLDGLASRARAVGVTAVTHAVKEDPADGIVSVAQQENADLIVVGNKGMKGVRRVLGSVPNDVAHRSPCSVLIVQTT
jgi:nucleotide-binding universal stress UspA family protein